MSREKGKQTKREKSLETNEVSKDPWTNSFGGARGSHKTQQDAVSRYLLVTSCLVTFHHSPPTQHSRNLKRVIVGFSYLCQVSRSAPQQTAIKTFPTPTRYIETSSVCLLRRLYIAIITVFHVARNRDRAGEKIRPGYSIAKLIYIYIYI